ncbi:calponin homology domain-containing protein, partial [Zopfochytrium polystomum]
MTESKTELLAWVNDLLQVNYLRIEQCGSGAAYCQIMDTIYGKSLRDVAMAKVKFNSRHEYDFLNNYKILQCTFNNHKIDKDIPVERLAKCKLNDNLEFLQWLKKFWDSHRPSVTTYNAAARRSSRERSQQSGSPAASISPMDATPATRSPGSARRKSAPPPRTRSATPEPLAGSSTSSPEQERKVKELTKQIMDLKTIGDTLERERNFYYLKLRDIEVLILARLDKDKKTDPILRKIQTILYSTEEGFVSP